MDIFENCLERSCAFYQNEEPLFSSLGIALLEDRKVLSYGDEQWIAASWLYPLWIPAEDRQSSLSEDQQDLSQPLEDRKTKTETHDQPESQMNALAAALEQAPVRLAAQQETQELEAWNQLFEKQKAIYKVVFAVTHPCSIAELPFESNPEGAHAMRDEVVRNVANHSNPKYRLALNFDPEDLTVDVLQFIFREVDRVFYSSSILQRVKEQGVTLEWAVTNFFMQDELQPSARTVALTPWNETLPKVIVFEFNRARWGASAAQRTTNGVTCWNKLTALCQTVLHELIHMIFYVYCREKNGHGEHFRRHNQKVNGATLEDTRFYDRPLTDPWPKTHESIPT